MKALDGKVAVILGASSGIGEGLARVLAGQRLKALVLSARREDLLNALAVELHDAHDVETLVMTTDASDPKQIQRLIDHAVAEYGRVDFFLYTAGMIQKETSVERIDPNYREVIYGVNLIAPANAASMVMRQFIRQGSGIYLAVSSHAGGTAFAGEADYCATKAGLDHFVRVMDIDMQPFRRQGKPLYAFAVGPGFINTVEARKQFPDVPQDVWDAAPTPDAFAGELLEYLMDPASALKKHGPVRHIKTV